MKKFLLLIFISVSGHIHAQRDDCGTPSPKFRLYPDSIFAQQMRTAVTYPLLMKVFVHVIADDDGSDVAAGDSSVMRQMQNMRDFYAPHGICFILAGYEQINSTDLNLHNTDTEEAELSGFLVEDVMNVFVHTSLSDNDGTLNGSAYDIPNYYLSVVRGAMTSTTNRSTLAHEMGHDFGLLHTFQSRRNANNDLITENVARSGSCKNCASEGDLLCDTEADRNISDNLINATNCTYTGSATDDCSTALIMAPTNIMTYGRRPCRSVFTTAQGNRAEDFILTTSYLTDAIAPDAITIATNVNFSSGRRFYVARNSVSVTASSLSITGTALVNFAAKEVTIPPGVTFAPTGNGYTAIRANGLCQ